jgi:hypothetical protein
MTTIENQTETMISQNTNLPNENPDIILKPKKVGKKKSDTNNQEKTILQLDKVEPMNAKASAFVAEAKKQAQAPDLNYIKDTIPAPNTIAEPEPEPAEEEEEENDEVLKAREIVEKAERKKLEKNIRTNIADHRKSYADQTENKRKEILVKLKELKAEFNALQTKIIDINEGRLDDEIIATQLVKNKKAKTKGEHKEPTYEGKGKPAGTGDARKKDIDNLNSGKTEKVTYAKKVGTNTWSLMFEGRRDGGLAVVKDNNGVYNIPLFKEIEAMIGVSIKTKKDYIEWVKK